MGSRVLGLGLYAWAFRALGLRLWGLAGILALRIFGGLGFEGVRVV